MIGALSFSRSLHLPVVAMLALAACATEGSDGQAETSGLLPQAGAILQAVLGNGGSAALGQNEIAQGLREALRVGTGRVVDTLGEVDGFNADPDVHIPLPGVLAQAQSSLSLIHI